MYFAELTTFLRLFAKAKLSEDQVKQLEAQLYWHQDVWMSLYGEVLICDSLVKLVARYGCK